MSTPTLNQLERDVEVARAKLADSLSTLTLPAVYTEFADELKLTLLQGKDAAILRVKTGLEENAAFYLEQLKTRAADNPAAVLAIAAGLAWRVFRKPPIATALVGVGVVSLLRGQTPEVRGHHENADYLSEATDRLKEQVTTMAGTVKDEAYSVGRTVTDKATELATAGKEQVMEWGEQARSTYQSESHDRLEASPARYLNRREGQRYLRGAVADDETTDSLLLGAAGLAVAGALAIAMGRATSDVETHSKS